ncbi:ATP-NAD kinase-like domain-containing protein [Dipodascopsis tothii]|uniref:ATP-NAD kinase-like domain-containing protein n=1 Tax=Dipodascopsis tothii TaxID=44089 RepID=UPI0034CE20DD
MLAMNAEERDVAGAHVPVAGDEAQPAPQALPPSQPIPVRAPADGLRSRNSGVALALAALGARDGCCAGCAGCNGDGRRDPCKIVGSPPSSVSSPASPEKAPAALFGSSIDSHKTAHVPGIEDFVCSPCFVHDRLDDAVDVAKVLKDISSDNLANLSHSRLVQTATGVRELAKRIGQATISINVRSVMIVTKARDNSLVYLTRQLAKWLMTTPRHGKDHGVCVYVDAKLRSSKRFHADGFDRNERIAGLLRYWTPELTNNMPHLFDLVLTLGGDGTVLYTSSLFQQIVPPVLAFSLGSLGFLTNFSFHDYQNHLNRVFERGIKVNLRMRFTCTIFRGGRPCEVHQVINEIVIDRGPSPFISMLELYGDNHLLTVVQADGLILSTPTGSTAYSLSAGGSLVHPEIPAISVTPICPHTLSFRPMLLPDSMLLRVTVPRGSRNTAWASFDGRHRVEIKPGDSVSIAASQYPFPTVVSSPMEYIESVSRTLRWNVREPQKPFRDFLDSTTTSINTTPTDETDDEWDIDDSSFFCTSGPGSSYNLSGLGLAASGAANPAPHLPLDAAFSKVSLGRS